MGLFRKYQRKEVFESVEDVKRVLGLLSSREGISKGRINYRERVTGRLECIFLFDIFSAGGRPENVANVLDMCLSDEEKSLDGGEQYFLAEYRVYRKKGYVVHDFRFEAGEDFGSAKIGGADRLSNVKGRYRFFVRNGSGRE